MCRVFFFSILNFFTFLTALFSIPFFNAAACSSNVERTLRGDKRDRDLVSASLQKRRNAAAQPAEGKERRKEEEGNKTSS